MFDIVPKNVSIATGKKNLSQIAKVLGQITTGVEFGDDKPSYIPINDFVRGAIVQMTNWFIQGECCRKSTWAYEVIDLIFNTVADVPDAEMHFHAHELMDATVQPKPIYISPNEIYTIHSLLLQQQEYLVRYLLL